MTELSTSVNAPIAILHARWSRRLGVPVVWAAAGVLVAAYLVGAGRRDLAPKVGLPLVGIAVLLAIAAWRRRAIIRPDSLEIHGLLPARRLAFADLKSFTYDARAYRLYVPIPFGGVARLVLRGKRRPVVFHAGFTQFDRFAALLVQKAADSVVGDMRKEIDKGGRVRFGRRLEVDRINVYARLPLGKKVTIPIERLHVDVADGSVFLSAQGKRLADFPVRSTPNLLAFPQLVQELDATHDDPRPDALARALAMG